MSILKARAKPLSFLVTFLVEPDEEGWHAWAPLLKGLHAEGKTASEALQRAGELAQLYLETLIEEGDSIPLGPEEDKTQAPPGDAVVHRETVTVNVLPR